MQIGRRVFDFNRQYATLRERKAAATSALRSTISGRGGAVEVVTEGDLVKFKIVATGKVVDSLDRALEVSEGLQVSSVVSFGRQVSSGFPSLARAEKITNRYGALASALEDVTSKIEAGLTPGQIEMLRRAGVDVEDLGNLDIKVVSMGLEEGSASKVAEVIAKQRRYSQMHGIQFIDNKGSQLVTFRYGQNKMMNEYQANLLMSITGHSFLNDEEIMDAIRTRSDGTVAKLFEKSNKRARAFLSARDISMSAGPDGILKDIIQSFNSRASSLREITLVIDPAFDFLVKFAGKENTGFFDPNFQAFYKNVNVSQTMDDLVSGMSLSDIQKRDMIDSFKKTVEDFLDSSSLSKSAHRVSQNGTWNSDVLMEHLKANWAGSDQEKLNFVNTIFTTIDQGYDGADQMNRRFMATIQRELNRSKRDLDRLIRSGGSAEEKIAAQRKLREVNSLIERIQGGELGQITGRGSMNISNIGFYMKNVFDASQKFTSELNHLGLVVAKQNLKRDQNLMGAIESINLSGIGSAGDEVYSDPGLVAFHREAFASREEMESLRKYQDNIAADFRATLEDGIVPQRLKKVLRRQANIDIESLAPEARFSALRAKETAQRITALLESGVGPREAPMLISMIHNSVATEAFRERKGFIAPRIPNMYRFGLAAEGIGTATEGTGIQLSSGSGLAKFKGFQLSSGDIIGAGEDILNFRIKDHKILLPFHAVSKYYNSLGGFDLDDKGLPKAVTYTDNEGMKRLGFYLFRQPTGPEEITFMQAKFDIETIESLIHGGSGDSFARAIDEMIGSGNYRTSQPVLKALKSIALSDQTIMGRQLVKSVLEQNQDAVDRSLADIFTKMAEAGKYSLTSLSDEAMTKLAGTKGFSNLMVSDLFDVTTGKRIDPQYTTRGIYKVLADEGAFDISDDILGTMRSYNISPELERQIRAGIQGVDAGQRTSKIFEILDTTDLIKDQEKASLISTVRGSMQNRAAQNAGGSLGTYINRTMIIGSTFDQYEQFLGKLDQNLASHMVEQFGIGLLPQETAIDISTTMARQKAIMATTAEIVSRQIGSISEAGLGSALRSLLNAGDAFDVDKAGAAAVENLGRRIGYGRAISGLISEPERKNLLLGVDEFFLVHKMNAADRERFLSHVVSGAEQAMAESVQSGSILNQIMTNSGSQVALSDLDEMKALLQRPNEEQLKDFLVREFGMGSEHSFASAARHQYEGARIKSILEETRRAFTASVRQNPAVVGADVTAEERRAASFLLDKYKDELDTVFGISKAERAALTDRDMAYITSVSEKLSQDFYGDMETAVRANNVSIRGLVTSFDQIAAETSSGIDIGRLRTPFDEFGVPITEGYDELTQKIFQSRRLNNIQHLLRFDTQNARAIFGAIKDLDGETLVEKAASALGDENLMNQMNDASKNTLRALVGNMSELVDENGNLVDETTSTVVRRQAGQEAQILQALMDEENLSSVSDALNARGTMATGITGDSAALSDAERAIINSTSADQQGPISKAVYKRFGEKIGESEFIDLIKSGPVKKAGLGTLGLIAASFAYKRFKDRSEDDITGPPLLPGGSAYEDMPSREGQLPDFGSGQNSGINFKVSLYGDRNTIAKFNRMAGSMVNGNINTTMYNRIQNVGSDPYRSIASSY